MLQTLPLVLTTRVSEVQMKMLILMGLMFAISGMKIVIPRVQSVCGMACVLSGALHLTAVHGLPC